MDSLSFDGNCRRKCSKFVSRVWRVLVRKIKVKISFRRRAEVHRYRMRWIFLKLGDENRNFYKKTEILRIFSKFDFAPCRFCPSNNIILRKFPSRCDCAPHTRSHAHELFFPHNTHCFRTFLFFLFLVYLFVPRETPKCREIKGAGTERAFKKSAAWIFYAAMLCVNYFV